MTTISRYLTIIITLLTAGSGWTQVPPLLLTELNTTYSYTFIEILNPNDSTQSLEHFYLSNSADYYLVVDGRGSGDQAGDFIVRFPADTEIATDERVIIVLGNTDDFESDWERQPDFVISPDEVDNQMVLPFEDAINPDPWETSSTLLILFYWDGETDLVADSDYIRIGEEAPHIDKTGEEIDGPDEDEETTTYVEEISEQDITPAHPDGILIRVDNSESDEQEDGNGLEGHNETSEPWSETWAATGVPTPWAENVELFLVEGVFQTDDGEAVAELTITLNELSTETDENGKFSFEPLESGEYILALDATDFFFSPITLTIEQNSYETYILTSAATLSGTISLEHHSGSLEGSIIRLVESDLETETDEQGNYEFPPFEPGTYTVEISHEGYVTYSSSLTIQSEATLDVTLETSDSFQVSGTIITLDRASAIRASVRLVGPRLDGGQVVVGVNSGSEGQDFHFGEVPAGTYRLEVTCDDYQDFILEPFGVWQPTELVIQLIPSDYQPEVITESCSTVIRQTPPPLSMVIMLMLGLGVIFWRRN